MIEEIAEMNYTLTGAYYVYHSDTFWLTNIIQEIGYIWLM